MLEKLQLRQLMFVRHITVIKDGNQVRMVELVGIHNMSQKDTELLNSSVMDMNFVCFRGHDRKVYGIICVLIMCLK